MIFKFPFLKSEHALKKAVFLAVMLSFILFSGVFSPLRAESNQTDITEEQNAATIFNENKLLKSKLEACAKVTSDIAERLHCYDEIAKRYGFIAEEDLQDTDKKLAQYGFWNIVERSSEIAGTTIYLKLDSVNAIRTASGTERKPTLILRCKDKMTDVYLDWGNPLKHTKGREKKMYLEYKFDDQEEVPQEWDLSIDFYSAFSPYPVDFVREMKGKKKAVFRLTPYGQGMASVLYKLEGFEQALSVLVNKCYK